MSDTDAKLPVHKTGEAAGGHRWGSLETLRREVDRLFEDFHHFGRHLPSRGSGLDTPRLARADWQVGPAFDLAEEDDGYEITAELPGIDAKNVQVKFSNNTLTIKGEKTETTEDKKKDYFLTERRFGSFQRSFPFPDGIDVDKIDASFSKGVLTVRLPKTADAKNAKRTIAIQAS